MPAPYIGNQDYRGYLNYLSQSPSGYAGTAKTLLNLVGNDAVFGTAGGVVSPELRRMNAEFYKNYQGYNAPTPAPRLPSIYSGGGGRGGGAPAPVYAPKLDVAAVSARARAAAEGAVNPFYTKQLNDFLAKQAFQRQTQKTQYETNVKNMEDQLKNTLEQNEITKTRAGEDVAENIAEVNQTADEFQTDTGQAFDEARLEQARNVSTGGLGQQQVAGTQQARNTQETRQVQKFKQAKEQQELFKTRTFDDLARSGKLASEKTTEGKKQAKFDLDTYLQNTEFEEKETRNALEQQRLEAIGREQGNQAKLLFNQYLAGISNPAQYQAAVQTYGGAF